MTDRCDNHEFKCYNTKNKKGVRVRNIKCKKCGFKTRELGILEERYHTLLNAEANFFRILKWVKDTYAKL